MEQMPKVSVIIPVYNAEKYLRQCLDSVVNQTLREIEIICVDDGSTDGSAEILKSYAENDSRIVPVRYTQNKSSNQARKDGVLMSRGTYIMFLDSDDSLELSACEELTSEMDRLGVDILQFGTFVDALPDVSKEAVDFFKRFVAPFPKLLYGKDVFAMCFKYKKYRFTIWNKIYRADLCKTAFNYVDDGFLPKAQDLYAFFILSWFAASYFGIEKKYYHYSYGRGITGSGKCASLSTFSRICSQHLVAKKCRNFLNSQGKLSEYIAILDNITRSFIDECVKCWINRVSPEDGPEGFRMLLESWTSQAVFTSLENNFPEFIESAAKKAIDLEFPWDCLMYAKPNAQFAFGKEYINSFDSLTSNGYTKVVPVVFAADDNYAVYSGVAIQSILTNASPDCFYRIYIIYTDISFEHIHMLESISATNVSVRCVNIQPLLTARYVKLYEKAHYTKEMFYRFLIPETFPAFPYAVYLDGDLVVETDIAAIIPDDMHNTFVAAVRNPATAYTAKHIREKLNLPVENYFNSGVMVFNITAWLKNSLVDQCFNAFKNIPKHTLLFPDQDILNIVCTNHTYFLDPAWNYCWHFIYGSKELQDTYAHIVAQVDGNPKIFHFTSGEKPWNVTERPLAIHFWKYALISPFFSEIVSRSQTNPSRFQSVPISSHGHDLGLKYRLEQAEKEIRNIRASASYRIGRFITWIPRKVRGFFRCCREHGWRYTCKRVLVHLHLK